MGGQRGGNHICTSAAPGGGVGADVLTNGSGGQTAPKDIHRGGMCGCLPPLAVYTPGTNPHQVVTWTRNVHRGQLHQSGKTSLAWDTSARSACGRQPSTTRFSSLHIPPQRHLDRFSVVGDRQQLIVSNQGHPRHHSRVDKLSRA